MKDVKEIARITREIHEINADPVDQNNISECVYLENLVRQANIFVSGLNPVEVHGALSPLRPDDCMIRLDDWIKSGADMAMDGGTPEMCELYEKARAAQRRLENLLIKIQKMENPKYVTRIDHSW